MEHVTKYKNRDHEKSNVVELVGVDDGTAIGTINGLPFVSSLKVLIKNPLKLKWIHMINGKRADGVEAATITKSITKLERAKMLAQINSV